MAYYPYTNTPMYQPAFGQPMTGGMDQQRQMPMQPMPTMQPQVPQPVQPQQGMLLGRAVSDVAEAKAVPSDLSGQPMFFPDLSHNAVHMKVFNPQTGCGDFFTFTLSQPTGHDPQKAMQRPAAAQVRYALADDFDALQGQFNSLRNDVNDLMDRLTAPDKGGGA